jgi:hypothetical protein
MANQNLENLVKTGSLKAEPPAHDEIARLIASGLARLDDSKNENLNLQSRFDLAYNAAHALSLGALRIAGYRADPIGIIWDGLYRVEMERINDP